MSDIMVSIFKLEMNIIEKNIYIKQHLRDLPESACILLSELSSFAKCVAGLLEPDALKQVQAMDAVSKVQEECKVMGKRALTILSSTLLESRWWKERVDSFVYQTCKLNVHKPRLDEVLLALSVDFNDDKDKVLKVLNKVVEHMLFLTEELDMQTMKPAVEKSIETLQSYWTWLHPQLQAEDCRVNLEDLCSLWSEASLAFPTYAAFNTYRSQVEAIKYDKVGKGKLSLLAENISVLNEAIVAKGELQPDVVEALLEAAAGAKGLDFKDVEPKPKILSVIEKTMDYMATTSKETSQRCLQILDALSPWLADEGVKQKFKFIKAVLDLEAVWEHFHPNDPVPEHDLLLAEDAKKHLQHLMQTLELAQGFLDKGMDWAQAKVKKLLADVTSFKDMASGFLLGKRREKVTTAMTSLEPMKGGCDEGSWTKKILDEHDWNRVLQVAETTIKLLDMKSLQSLLKQLEEALHIKQSCLDGVIPGNPKVLESFWLKKSGAKRSKNGYSINPLCRHSCPISMIWSSSMWMWTLMSSLSAARLAGQRQKPLVFKLHCCMWW